MKSVALGSILVCALGAGALAGCASSPSSSAATAASPQSSVQTGKVAAVETTAVVDRTVAGSSSGSSTVVTTASGGPSVLTVQFNDGQQSKYMIEQPARAHTVGEPVYVITQGDRVAIVPAAGK